MRPRQIRASLLDARGSEFQIVGWFARPEEAKTQTEAACRGYWRTPAKWEPRGRTKGRWWAYRTLQGRTLARIVRRAQPKGRGGQ